MLEILKIINPKSFASSYFRCRIYFIFIKLRDVLVTINNLTSIKCVIPMAFDINIKISFIY